MKKQQHLAIYITGKTAADSWKSKGEKADFYFVKGVVEQMMSLLGIKISAYNIEPNDKLDNCITALVKNDASCHNWCSK